MPAFWTPPGSRFLCFVCGEEVYGQTSYEKHVVDCCREHEGAIHRYSEQKRPDALFAQADPEYREWQHRTGKLI